jgi:NADH:ubiquinone oxidoreductase subunit B-like Fe-S oxidoreductase
VKKHTYRLLKKNPGVHWYCKGCDPGVGKILKTLVMLQQKQEKLEERQGKLEKRWVKLKMKMQKEGTELEKD